MARQQTLQRCIDCDELTGKAGEGDDSLFSDCGHGPLCDTCHTIAELYAENARLRMALKVQREYVVRLREGYGASVPVIALTQDSIDLIDKALKGGR